MGAFYGRGNQLGDCNCFCHHGKPVYRHQIYSALERCIRIERRRSKDTILVPAPESAPGNVCASFVRSHHDHFTSTNSHLH